MTDDDLRDEVVRRIRAMPEYTPGPSSASANLPVYRVQAADGRGPWRPGFSQTWIDADAPSGRLVETVFDLVPYAVLRSLPSDMAWGSACRTLGDLMQWFTPRERRTLAALGYYPVRLNADLLLARSDWQLFVGRRRPFNDGATRLRWPL
jgi:hypothetical protein